jgi:hypothetical protein
LRPTTHLPTILIIATQSQIYITRRVHQFFVKITILNRHAAPHLVNLDIWWPRSKAFVDFAVLVLEFDQCAMVQTQWPDDRIKVCHHNIKSLIWLWVFELVDCRDFNINRSFFQSASLNAQAGPKPASLDLVAVLDRPPLECCNNVRIGGRIVR